MMQRENYSNSIGQNNDLFIYVNNKNFLINPYFDYITNLSTSNSIENFNFNVKNYLYREYESFLKIIFNPSVSEYIPKNKEKKQIESEAYKYYTVSL